MQGRLVARRQFLVSRDMPSRDAHAYGRTAGCAHISIECRRAAQLGLEAGDSKAVSCRRRSPSRSSSAAPRDVAEMITARSLKKRSAATDVPLDVRPVPRRSCRRVVLVERGRSGCAAFAAWPADAARFSAS